MSYRFFIPIILLSYLSFQACQRKTPKGEKLPNTSVVTTAERAGSTDIPIVEDAEFSGPGIEERYAPIRYAPYPTKNNRDLAKIGPLPAASNACDFVGEVWDFADLDGCGMLVETTDGHLFSVAGLPQGYFLEPGSRIRFGFRYADARETNTNCVHQDAVIRITCMQALRPGSGFSRPFVCESFNEPSEWIHELIQDLGATYVTRFPWTEERVVYLFESPGGQYLYDCRGFLICQPKSNCLRFIEDFSKGTQIFGD